jgi:hypothetical protein
MTPSDRVSVGPSSGEPVAAETRLSAERLAAIAGISREELDRWVGLGLVEPVAPGAGEFTVSTAIRVQRMWRLHGDLGVDLFGAAIIVDLVDRMEQLEAEVRRIRQEPR